MNLLPPDVRVLNLAEPIQELGDVIRGHSSDVQSQIGTWESDVEAFNLILLAATHAIAAGDLARSSVSLLAPARALARAAMEAGARALWLLSPEEPFAREARWLAHLDGEIRIAKRLEEFLGQEAFAGSTVVQEFSDAVRAKLPPDVVVPARVPNFKELLRAIGAPEKYPVYAYLSQTSHATHNGTQVFHKHLGTFKQLGDFATADDWWLPLSTIWWFLATPALAFSDRCGIASPTLAPLPLQQSFVKAQNWFKGGRPESPKAAPTGRI